MTTPRYVIEFPESVRLSVEARRKIEAEWERWLASPDPKPAVLASGGQVRVIGGFDFRAFVSGAIGGGALVAIAQALS